jgi:peptide/nickel transport system substrate-binding protein
MTTVGLRVGIFASVLAVLVGCAGPGAAVPPPQQGDRPAAAPAAAERIVIGIAREPRVLASTFAPGGQQATEIYELMSQGLATTDAEDRPIPRLATNVPSLDEGTWQLRPDGGMATTFRLQDAALWHDRTPVTMEDVLFSFQVYRDPRVPVSNRVLEPVERVEPLDARTLVVHWKETHALADRLGIRELTILPRHLLEGIYERDPASLEQAPYWTDSLIGAGAYRLVSWERGNQLELEAFDGYYLGKPKTLRITLRFVPDENTMLAQVFAEQVDVVEGLGVNRVAALRPQIKQAGIGDFQLAAGNPKQWVFQNNPANNPASAPFRELRVRQAMTHALDRAPMAEFGTAGLGGSTDSWIPTDDPRYPGVESVITRYPNDPRRSVALLEEAGWTRGSDGTLRDLSSQPLTCEIRGNSQEDLDLIAIGAQMWRAVGIETGEVRVPPSLVNDNQYRASYPCIEVTSRPGLSFYHQFPSGNARSAATGWRGQNRSGWSHPEVDDAIERLLGSPRESDRLVAEREMVRVITREAPIIFVYFSLETLFTQRGLTGPGVKRGRWSDGVYTWNVHLWEKR